MKNTTKFLLGLAVLFLISCASDDEIVPEELKVKTGKIFFKIKEDPLKPIELTNARLSHQQARENRYELTFMQDGEVVAQFREDQFRDTLEMPVGIYEVNLKQYILEGRYEGRLASEGSVQANIKADETLVDPIVLIPKYMYITVTLNNLPDATIWIGEEGFEPTDEDLMGLNNAKMFFIDTENFEVIVEFEEERKRYTAKANTGWEYFIHITRDEEEPIDMGKIKLEYFTHDSYPERIDWKW